MSTGQSQAKAAAEPTGQAQACAATEPAGQAQTCAATESAVQAEAATELTGELTEQACAVLEAGPEASPEAGTGQDTCVNPDADTNQDAGACPDDNPDASAVPDDSPDAVSETDMPETDDGGSRHNKWFARACHALAAFFVQSFRPRSKEDYTEIFLRGLKGHKEGIRNKYPWFYLRFLGLFIVLVSLSFCIYYLTGNSLGAAHFILYGACIGCVAFLLLIYELYTGNDISLVQILAVMLLGGFASICITQLGYKAYIPSGDWAEPFWVGFWEEFCKGIVALVIVVSLRKKDPFAAFLIGVAVGAGFALSENAGYIYVYSAGLVRVAEASSLVLTRSVMAVCTHMTWTGIIAWAFAKFRKPFINLRFWGCVALSMLLHALWDLPDAGWVNVVVTICCIITGFAMEILIIYMGKMPACELSPGDTIELQLSINLETGLIGGTEKDAAYYRKAGNLAGSLCVVAAALFMMCFFAFDPFATRYNTITYTDVDEFISLAQDGMTIEADRERPYDDTVPTEENYSYTVTDGILRSCIQRLPAVIDGEVKDDAYILYKYDFIVYSDEDTDADSEDTDGTETDGTENEGDGTETDGIEGDGTDDAESESTDGESAGTDSEGAGTDNEGTGDNTATGDTEGEGTDGENSEGATGDDTDNAEGEGSEGATGDNTDGAESEGSDDPTGDDTDGSEGNVNETGDDTDNTEGEDTEDDAVLPTSVYLLYDGVPYACSHIGDKNIFTINKDYSGWTANSDGTVVSLKVQDTSVIWAAGGYALLTLAGCSLAGGIISFAVCRAKSGRKKKNVK